MNALRGCSGCFENQNGYLLFFWLGINGLFVRKKKKSSCLRCPQVLPPSLHEELGGRRLGCRRPGEAPRLGWQGTVRVWVKSLPHGAGQAALSRIQAKSQELG